MKRKKEIFYLISLISGILIMFFILLPLIKMITQPSISSLKEAIKDKEVIKAISLSLYASGMAALISLIIGTPFAFLLARKDFIGKRFIESVIDLPIVIPHPVVGIAILSVVGKNYWLGEFLYKMGIKVMGSVTGIITVLTFVGMPFYINSVKDGFLSISPRIENISRTLGASMTQTFFRITLPLALKSMLVGIIMCIARAISEFGAVVIVAYHPMVAPVLIYERFEAYGLKYSQPVAVLLIIVCLILFFILRIISLTKKEKAL